MNMNGFRLRALGFGPVTAITLASLIFFTSCGGPAPQQQAAQPPGEVAKPAPPPPAPYYVYVTNETGDNLTVINGGTDQVEVTIPLGKRPRGVKVSPDGKQLFVALSGSPIGGPGVDESKLPPADKKADGVAVVDIGSRQIVKMLHGGSDPEQISLSKDGTKLFVSNEDKGALS